MADELNRWLRRVRPPTAADDSWADSEGGNRALSDIHRGLDHRRLTHRRVTDRRMTRRARVVTLLPIATVAAAAVAVLVVTQSSPPASTTPNLALPSITARPAAKFLTPFASCTSLLTDLRTHAVAHSDQFGYGLYAGYGPGLSAGLNGATAPLPALDQAAASNAAGSIADTSTTNVQEAGVDEPDIVKTDGDRVLTVTDGRLRVIDAHTRTQTGSLDLRSYAGSQDAQLLVSGDSAVVLLQPSGTVNYGGGPVGGVAVPIGPAPVTNAISTALYVSLSGDPHVVGSLQLDGGIVDARMVGSTVRIVAASRPSITLPGPGADQSKYQAQVRGAIRTAPLKAWLPSYTVSNGSSSKTTTVGCSAVSHPTNYSATSMLTLYTVDPAKPGADPQPVSLTADGSTVYATTSSLYVASTDASTNTTMTTQLHRFDITGSGKPTYLGSGSVRGSLLNQYSMSDYKGSLRIATTSDAQSGVTVLDDTTLTVTGMVTGLGKGERLYAVRFLGALGYVVTYNQMDPLYVLDLSDPHHPRLDGSLEIPGYSSYLHDAGDGRLIGVGEDTTLVDEGGGKYARPQGLLVQLFDVSNPAKPVQTARVVLSNTPGYTAFDPHAFLYWSQTGLIVAPVTSYGGQQSGDVLAVHLAGTSLTKIGTISHPAGSIDPIVRSMIVDGNLWTFSAGGIRVSTQSTLAQQTWIPST